MRRLALKRSDSRAGTPTNGVCRSHKHAGSQEELCHSCESRNPQTADSERLGERNPAFAGMTDQDGARPDGDSSGSGQRPNCKKPLSIPAPRMIRSLPVMQRS